MNYSTRTKEFNILIFLVLTLIVVVSTLIIMKPVFNTGFTSDDWIQLIYYKVYKNRPFELWQIRGAYTTTQAYYIGILTDIFGLNYRAIQTVNIFFKILATLSIYPLVFSAFRKKLLAFLTTLLYAINYTTSKPLEFPVKGGEYLGILFMALFLTTYAQIVRKRKTNLKWLLLLGILFLLGIFIAPIRIYPIAIFILVVEIYIFLARPKFFTPKSSILRILAIYLIPATVFFYKPSAITTYLIGFVNLKREIINGNLHILLTPLQGIGYSFLTDRQWGWIFNPINTSTFKYYLFSLFVKPIFLFTVLTLLISKLTTKKITIFSVASISITMLFISIVFFVGLNFWGTDNTLRLSFDTNRLYSTIFGAFILNIATLLYFHWKYFPSENKILLLACPVGIVFAIIFIVSTWLFSGYFVSYSGTQQYYLVVASLGTSLFIASLSSFFYDTFKDSNRLAILTIIIIYPFMFKVSLRDVTNYFVSNNSEGRGYVGQQMMQNKIKEKINLQKDGSFLVYLDAHTDKKNSTYYERTILTNFGWFMHYNNGEITKGCISLFYEDKKFLRNIIKFDKKHPSLQYKSVCINSNSIKYDQIISYDIKDFYAFELRNFELIDIKSKLLSELNIQ